MKKLLLEILTPERELYTGDVQQVVIPTVDGEITVLPDHIPLLSLLRPGEIIIHVGKSLIPLVVSGGFLELRNNKLQILADTAEKVEEIDEERALEAQDRAKKALESQQLDSTEHAYFASKLQKELMRVKISRKYRS